MSARIFSQLVIALIALAIPACAPRPVYRPPLASRSSPLPNPPASQAPVSAARPPINPPRPLIEDARIKEQDLKEKFPAAPDRPGDQSPPAAPSQETPALPDDSSLLAKITPTTPPQRAASLRLTDEGRKLLDAGDNTKALARLEKTIAIDSTNAYGYFYLAKAHFRLGRYQESLNFLDVAESLLAADSYWLAEVYALRGENFRALGAAPKAESSYAQALRLNSGNRVAAEGLTRLRGEPQPSY